MSKKSLIAFFGSIAFIAICYFYFDKPIAYVMHNLHFPRYQILKWINPCYAVRILSFVLLVGLGIKAMLRPLSRIQRLLFSCSIACGLSIFLKNTFKGFFGRYWPESFNHNNPSLIKDQAYGFHFWKWDEAHASFPSGHTALVFCAMTYLWVVAPKWRWLAALVCLFQTAVALLYNFHFLGDLIGGALLGSMCAAITIKIGSKRLLN